MKNLVILFVTFFALFLVSCSDVTDNSMLTNPIMEKSITTTSDLRPSPVYPYSYLYSFTKVEEVKYLTPENENSIECFMSVSSKFIHLYAVVEYTKNSSPKMFFINEIADNSFKIEGIKTDDVSKISVYGFALICISRDQTYPFVNNSYMNSITNIEWKQENSDISVRYSGIVPSSLKYIYAEISTNKGDFLVFLQRPYSNKFVIPEYGKYNVTDVKLFEYHSFTETGGAVK